jgi:hypothetical protein
VDSAAVLNTLIDFDFDLVLTGHKHHPYIEKHIRGDRSLLLIGGPTVGTYAADNTFRGLRWLEIDDDNDKRSFRIFNLQYTFG